MEEESKIEVEPVIVLGFRDQLIKVVICSTVGFLATKAAEHVFDNLVKRQLTHNATIIN